VQRPGIVPACMATLFAPPGPLQQRRPPCCFHCLRWSNCDGRWGTTYHPQLEAFRVLAVALFVLGGRLGPPAGLGCGRGVWWARARAAGIIRLRLPAAADPICGCLMPPLHAGRGPPSMRQLQARAATLDRLSASCGCQLLALQVPLLPTGGAPCCHAHPAGCLERAPGLRGPPRCGAHEGDRRRRGWAPRRPAEIRARRAKGCHWVAAGHQVLGTGRPQRQPGAPDASNPWHC
jgi:hypothetical protein